MGTELADEIYAAPCPVEGCEYGGSKGCGLTKLMTNTDHIAAFDADLPIVRDCKASRLTEAILGIKKLEDGSKVMNLSDNQFFEIVKVE